MIVNQAGGAVVAWVIVGGAQLAKDPNADFSGAGYLYAPGSPVAVWS